MNINIKGLEFGYSGVPVLNDVTFDINCPQLVAILGPNGVGKSTLIHCMNKILEPSAGSVIINDKEVNNYSLKNLAKIIGYVPYASSDSFPMTVVDTVLLGRHPHSNWRSIDNDLNYVFNTLKLLGIDDLAMRPFNELSAGQHQKVMLARGLVQEPQILLLDEPTANLDVKHQIEVTRMLRDLSKSKQIIIIMICHDLNIAAKYADNIIMMHEGSIFAVGPASEVITESNIREVYEIDSKIITDMGRPHVILRDDVDVNQKIDIPKEQTSSIYIENKIKDPSTV